MRIVAIRRKIVLRNMSLDIDEVIWEVEASRQMRRAELVAK